MKYVIFYSNIKDVHVMTPTEPQAFADSLPSFFNAYLIESDADLGQVPKVALVSMYNRAIPSRPVKDFDSRKIAVSRVWPLMASLCRDTLPSGITLRVPGAEQVAEVLAAGRPKKNPDATDPAPAKKPGRKKSEDTVGGATAKAPRKAKAASGEGAGGGGDDEDRDYSPVRGKRLGIGVFIADQLKQGKTTEQVLAAVKENFPDSRAKPGDVSIMRGKIAAGVA